VDDLARISLRPLTGALRVGATTTTTEGRFLPTVLQRFASAYPEVALDLQVDNSTTVLRSVLGGEVGVAIVAADVDDPALTATALAPEEQTVVVSGDHPLAGSATEPSVLRGSVFLLREGGSATRKYQELLLAQWRIPGVRTWTLASTSAIVAAVAAGLGISCLPRVVCRDALALGRLGELTLEPSPRPRPVCLVRRTDHHLTRAEEHFLALIAESAHP
jgi:DNA-binding transcriptional LysR family regulator